MVGTFFMQQTLYTLYNLHSQAREVGFVKCLRLSKYVTWGRGDRGVIDLSTLTNFCLKPLCFLNFSSFFEQSSILFLHKSNYLHHFLKYKISKSMKQKVSRVCQRKQGGGIARLFVCTEGGGGQKQPPKSCLHT